MSKLNSFPNFPKGSAGCSIWRGLSKVFELLKLLTMVEPSVNGKVRFWIECWCSKSTLSASFPKVFEACFNKDGLLSAFAKVDCSGVCSWAIPLPRRLPDQTISELAALLEVLDTAKMVDDDTLQWIDGSRDSFNVKTFFHKIIGFRRSFFGHTVKQFRWKELWSSKVPAKTNFFLWVLNHGGTLTQANLMRSGFSLAESCPMCREAEQDLNHLFFDCKFASLIWAVFLGDNHHLTVNNFLYL